MAGGLFLGRFWWVGAQAEDEGSLVTGGPGVRRRVPTSAGNTVRQASLRWNGMLALKSGCGKLLQVLLAWDGGFRHVLSWLGARCSLVPCVVCARR